MKNKILLTFFGIALISLIIGGCGNNSYNNAEKAAETTSEGLDESKTLNKTVQSNKGSMTWWVSTYRAFIQNEEKTYIDNFEVLVLYDKGKWNMGGMTGTWELAPVDESETELWKIYEPRPLIDGSGTQKITFYNWYSQTAFGLVETYKGEITTFTITYRAEQPFFNKSGVIEESFNEPKYEPLPLRTDSYTIKKQDEGLLGRHGIMSKRIFFDSGSSEYYPLEGKLHLADNSKWKFKEDVGDWHTEEITAEDWEKWGNIDFSASRKIVLEGWTDKAAEGPIKEYRGDIYEFWLVYRIEPPYVSRAGTVWIQFKLKDELADFGLSDDESHTEDQDNEVQPIQDESTTHDYTGETQSESSASAEEESVQEDIYDNLKKDTVDTEAPLCNPRIPKYSQPGCREK